MASLFVYLVMSVSVSAVYPLNTIFPQTVAHTQQINNGGSPLPFLAWLPPAYAYTNSNYKLPVVVFLNGRGEIGDGSEYDLRTKCASWGPMKFINGSVGQWFYNNPAIHIAPQISGNSWDATWRGKEGDLDGLLAYVLEAFNADTDRIYLLGMSMGGAGTLFYGQKFSRAAVIVPMSAGANSQYESYPSSYTNFVNQTVWIGVSAYDTYDPPVWFTGWPDAATNSQTGNEGWLGGMAAASGCTVNCRPLDTHPNNINMYGSNTAEKPYIGGITSEYTGYYTESNGWQWASGMSPQASYWQITMYAGSYAGVSDQHWVGWLNTMGTYEPNTMFWSWLFQQRNGVRPS